MLVESRGQAKQPLARSRTPRVGAASSKTRVKMSMRTQRRCVIALMRISGTQGHRLPKRCVILGPGYFAHAKFRDDRRAHPCRSRALGRPRTVALCSPSLGARVRIFGRLPPKRQGQGHQVQIDLGHPLHHFEGGRLGMGLHMREVVDGRARYNPPPCRRPHPLLPRLLQHDLVTAATSTSLLAWRSALVL